MTLPGLSQQLGRTIAPASQLLEVVQTLARLPAQNMAPIFLPVTALEEVPSVSTHG
ncbi:MAG: hypothetical protein ACYDAR_04195 [Thermomicrobiales bacterium]